MKLFLPTFIILTILLSSCSSIYMPNVPNTPMLTTKGEIAVGGHISLKGNFNFNTAYAVTHNFAVMFNGGFMNNESRKKDTENNTLEVGAGYFTTFGQNKNRVIEVYGGVGSGKSVRLVRDFDANNVLTNIDNQSAGYDKKFIQVNFSSIKKDDINLFGVKFGLNYGTALRMSFVKTNDFFINSSQQQNEDNIFFEPVFFTRMILSDQFQLQYTSGGNFGLKSRKFLNANHSVFSIGAVINIGREAKK